VEKNRLGYTGELFIQFFYLVLCGKGAPGGVQSVLGG
jgi:hypothetical protein